MSSQSRGSSFPPSSDLAPSSTWDRITTWASEHKAVVYTAVGVAVVVSGAGVIYYLSDSKPKDHPSEKKKSSKKAKRKSAQDKEPQQDQGQAREAEQRKLTQYVRFQGGAHGILAEQPPPRVQADPLEGIPEIDETTVDTLSDQVSSTSNRFLLAYSC